MKIAAKNYSTQTHYSTAFIGLGAMGAPMAAHLAAAGHKVRIYNRSQAKAKQWLDTFPGQAFLTPAEAALDADFVMMCVGNDNDLRSVSLGAQGVLASMKADSILIDHTTVSATIAKTLHIEAQSKGVRFIDAPVSGGTLGAENGTLTVMCGGTAKDFNIAKPVMQCYGANVALLGAVGSGQLAKMVNQICIAGLLQALAEALAFGEKAGLDMTAVLQAIGKGAAQSWQMEKRGPTMLEDKFDFGFALDWMRKDLGLCLEQARLIGAQLPVTALVDQFYADLQMQNKGRQDTSSLIQRLRH